jgi:2-keto-4-pentenoate hydratase/2-oxohepta-3-ene-1,7-dioic acid hydratase in catechol pathway
MGFRLANVAGRAVLVDGERYFDVGELSGGALPSDPMAALAQPVRLHELHATLADRSPTGRLGDVVLGPPVPQPQKSFAVGLNYLDHAAEGAMEVPANPLVFTKFPSCLVGPTADVELRTDFCDYEGELVVVIGPGGKDIAPADAWSHVAGLMVGQDISDRVVQFAAKPPHFDLGKSFDTFGPTGPVLVSTDLAGDPAELRIVTSVNGDERQNDKVASMVFDVPTLIGYLSQITTLVTGDLIFTGTPAGIGATQSKFLVDGDVITTTIEGIGTLANRCRRVSDHTAPGDKAKEAAA